ncbi:MAG: ABC transporter permease subunit [Acidimicrobiales bacterium]
MPLAALPAFLIVGVLTAGGLIGVVRTSLQEGLVAGTGFGLGAWARTLSEPGFRRAVAFTLGVTLTSTGVSVAASVVLALLLRRSRRARAVLAVPVAAPHLVVAALAVMWLGPGGLVDRLAEVVGGGAALDRTGWAVVGVYVAKEVPFLVLLASAALDEATAELEATAALLGAGPWARLRDVILPRLLVPLVVGGLVTAAFVVGAVEVPLLVGQSSPRMLGPYALDVVRLHGPAARAEAAVAELVAAAVTAGVALAAAVLGQRHHRRQCR